MKYNHRHDAYYDELSDSWDEEVCAWEDCYFCEGRPERPSLVTEVFDGEVHVEHELV